MPPCSRTASIALEPLGPRARQRRHTSLYGQSGRHGHAAPVRREQPQHRHRTRRPASTIQFVRPREMQDGRILALDPARTRMRTSAATSSSSTRRPTSRTRSRRSRTPAWRAPRRRAPRTNDVRTVRRPLARRPLQLRVSRCGTARTASSRRWSQCRLLDATTTPATIVPCTDCAPCGSATRRSAPSAVQRVDVRSRPEHAAAGDDARPRTS